MHILICCIHTLFMSFMGATCSTVLKKRRGEFGWVDSKFGAFFSALVTLQGRLGFFFVH
jgi:hypothetical protein